MMYHCIAIGFCDLSDAEHFEHVRNTALHSQSTTARKTPKKATVAITTSVVEITSSRLGQVTCFISSRTSCRNSRVSVNRAGDLTADLACSGADSAL